MICAAFKTAPVDYREPRKIQAFRGLSFIFSLCTCLCPKAFFLRAAALQGFWVAYPVQEYLLCCALPAEVLPDFASENKSRLSS